MKYLLTIVLLLFTFNSLLFSQELKTTHDDNSNITGIYYIEPSYFTDCSRNVVEGEIIKVNYDESEVYINMVVIEDNEQNRIQIRIDPKIESRMANADKGKLYQFLKKGKKRYFDCNICGSGNYYSAISIYISKQNEW